MSNGDAGRNGRGFGVVVAGLVALFLVSAVLMVVLPAGQAELRQPSARTCATHPGECVVTELVDPELTETITILPADPVAAAARNARSSWARGREIYLREGCASCHTQQVRPVLADAGLGPVSQPGDYVWQGPPLLGTRRVGPDLANAGTRPEANSCDSATGYLRDAHRPAATHISEADMTDLASYLTSLRPAGAPGPLTCDVIELAELSPTAAAALLERDQPADVTPTVPAADDADAD